MSRKIFSPACEVVHVVQYASMCHYLTFTV